MRRSKTGFKSVCSKPEVQQNAMFLPCAGVRGMYMYAEYKEAFAVDIGFLIF
jgi:hypothetical protein